MKKGIKSVGAYLPYNYLTRMTLGKAWGGKGGKGEKSIADVDEDSITMAVWAASGLSAVRIFMHFILQLRPVLMRKRLKAHW